MKNHRRRDRVAMRYEFESDTTGVTNLVVRDRWSSEARDAWDQRRADGLVLNHARGFTGDLTFLHGLRVRRLQVTARDVEDLLPVYASAETLEVLSIATARTSVLDLSRLPRLRSLSVENWAR